MMGFDEVKAALLEGIRQLEVIDCHEHLGPEPARTGEPVDVLNLFSHYTALDLLTAGMSRETFQKLGDPAYPLDHRWSLFSPYLPQIRFGSYARAAFIAARELYGFEDINDSTYRPLSEAMQKANKPGIYNWILRERCNIRCCLTQCDSTAVDGDLLIPLMWWMNHGGMVTSWRQVQERAGQRGRVVNTLDDYLDLLDGVLAQWKQEGVVGVKTRSQPYPDGDRRQAAEAFEDLRTGRMAELPELHPLNTFLLEYLFQRGPAHELMVAVHTGMWEDFRVLDCKHMIPFFMRHPQTRFDLYHLSFPSLHDAVIIGKNFGNVWLNLCWTHIMSPTVAREGIREILDFVPVNKVFAFGGDYMAKAVDKVVGHLRLAQDDVATVLAERVEEGLMTEDQALTIARKWFWDNPREAYRLAV